MQNFSNSEQAKTYTKEQITKALTKQNFMELNNSFLKAFKAGMLMQNGQIVIIYRRD